MARGSGFPSGYDCSGIDEHGQDGGKRAVGQFNGEPSQLPSLWRLDIKHKTDHKTAPRATVLERALKTIFKKKVVRYREGLDRRFDRAQTRFYFSNLDPNDSGALGGARA
jgi:hypothetical protein